MQGGCVVVVHMLKHTVHMCMSTVALLPPAGRSITITSAHVYVHRAHVRVKGGWVCVCVCVGVCVHMQMLTVHM